MLRTHDNSLKSLYGSLLGTYPSYLICSSYSRPLGSGRPSQLYGRIRYQTHILLFFVLSYEDSIAGEIIEQVTLFCDLGSITSDDARCNRGIKRRIAMRKEAFSRREELLSGGLKKCLK